MQLFPGWSLVAGGGMTDEYDCNCYLWEFAPDEFALFDAGAGRNVAALMQRVEEAGGTAQQIRYLFLTHHHADHVGGAAELRERTGAQVVASHHTGEIVRQADEERMGLRAAREAGGYPATYRVQPCPIDIIVEDGAFFELGGQQLQILATPGHCAGALSFLVHWQGQRGLIAGDVIFPGGRISLLNLPDCSLSDYSTTIARLAELKIDFLLPGHLEAQLHDASASILFAQSQFQRLLIPACYYHPA
ncbi:MBL fold metallo-hydrolase [Tengunoibacter tsumagoiensis]|uniref:Metallo-beta-lactamase domain-containing protein n=1 Tax=Tengunoibacter tsumagoiensis TaxID=2014871 RepID=A0A402A9B9_9CHLR|nr:MBL fold metallo-hydrolase [Tengunoibacter tsumagoiensis]GCE15740.1 hypothetical protein KTT_55990 [Tengunoibacter tsumagoiensis]